MNSIRPEGIIVPLVTPMNDDGSINVSMIESQVNRMIDSGVDGIFAFGTNGEGYILTFDEKREVLSAIISAVAGRVPVYAGTGAISTDEAVRTSRMAEESGTDFLSVITPSFAKASQNEICRYYEEIAHSVDLPVIIYNIPARTGNAVAPETIGRLARISNIVGAKDSSGDFTNTLSYIQAGCDADPDFSILSGNDRLIIWTLLAGGKGGIAGCANVYPHTLASIYDLYKARRIEEAIKVNESLSPFRALFRLGNPNTIVKKAVQLLGYDVGECRAPFNRLDTSVVEMISSCIESDMKRGLR